MRIIDLDPTDDDLRDACARLLVEGFREHSPEAWPTHDDAVDEIDEVCTAGPAKVAVDGDLVLGWIGVHGAYASVFEIHPLVVDPACRGQGVGKALVAAVEEIVGDLGGGTLLVGAGDEDGMTSLAGVDLYPDPLVHLRDLEDRKGHPFVFWRRCGFAVVGVVPDANGPGKPDILLAKRVPPR